VRECEKRVFGISAHSRHFIISAKERRPSHVHERDRIFFDPRHRSDVTETCVIFQSRARARARDPSRHSARKNDTTEFHGPEMAIGIEIIGTTKISEGKGRKLTGLEKIYTEKFKSSPTRQSICHCTMMA